MTLHASCDSAGRYHVNDGLHYANDLTRDEYLVFRAEYETGTSPATALFAHAEQRRPVTP